MKGRCPLPVPQWLISTFSCYFYHSYCMNFCTYFVVSGRYGLHGIHSPERHANSMGDRQLSDNPNPSRLIFCRPVDCRPINVSPAHRVHYCRALGVKSLQITAVNHGGNVPQNLGWETSMQLPLPLLNYVIIRRLILFSIRLLTIIA